MIKNTKEYFFLIYLPKPKSKPKGKIEIEIKESENYHLQFISAKEPQNYIINMFKLYSNEGLDSLGFYFDNKNYKLQFNNTRDQTFIFNPTLVKSDIFFKNTEINQNEISLNEKMNYFIDFILEFNLGKDKLDKLYNDSIKLYYEYPSFDFLINIFTHVYNTNLCAELLKAFNKNFDNPKQYNSNILKLKEYELKFQQIYKDSKNIISKYSLNNIDFYGLILIYLNNNCFDRYKNVFEELYTNNKNILFEIMLKYKCYFNNQIELSKEVLNEIIKFSLTKDFQTFEKCGLFYLNDITNFIDIILVNKNEIIKMKDFIPIEIPKIKDKEIIDFNLMKQKIEEIIEFSTDNNKLLIFLNGYFWESMSKYYSNISKENIEFISNLRILFIKYNRLINTLFKDDRNNQIRKDINSFFKKGILTRQIEKMIEEYIKYKPNITNIEIIELIKEYSIYYSDEIYINKRDPEILSKINLEDVNDEFIQKFREMKFEEIFKFDLENFLLVFLNKIKNISDFDILLKLINIDFLDDKKSFYLKSLKNKFHVVIKSNNITKDDEIKIKNLVNLSYYIYRHEEKIDFIKDEIDKSQMIDERIKSKIYLELMKLGIENKEGNIIEHIKEVYPQALILKDLNEFILYLMNFKEEERENIIDNIDNQFYITEKDFYSCGESQNIKLFKSITEIFNLNKNNKFFSYNIKVLKKIFDDFDTRALRYEYLKNLNNDKAEIVMEKLNLLTYINNGINKDEIYKNIKIYYKDMKDSLDTLFKYKNTFEEYKIKNEEIFSVIKSYIDIIKNDTYDNFIKRKLNIQNFFDDIYIAIEKRKDGENGIKLKNNQLIKQNKNDEEIINLKKENKKLKDINSRFPFVLEDNEYIFVLIIKTKDEKVIFSLICKNTDKFRQVEDKFYKEYPEYLEYKGNFKKNNKIINNNKTLEDLKLKNNDIIIFENNY